MHSIPESVNPLVGPFHMHLGRLTKSCSDYVDLPYSNKLSKSQIRRLQRLIMVCMILFDICISPSLAPCVMILHFEAPRSGPLLCNSHPCLQLTMARQILPRIRWSGNGIVREDSSQRRSNAIAGSSDRSQGLCHSTYYNNPSRI